MPESRDTRRLGGGMITAAWLLAMGLLWFLFDGHLEQRNNPNQHLQVLTETDRQELVLQRNVYGHYLAPGRINGRPVTFLLDTGATLVSIPAHLGNQLGLVPGGYQRMSTANGDITTRTTRIDHLQLGPLALHDVRADLNPGMDDDEILLGMSALKHWEFTQRSDVLILRPLP